MNAEAVSAILFAAWTRFSKACELDGRGRKGGFLCVAEPSGKIVLVCQIGRVDNLKDARLFRLFCQEKAIRLAQNPGHISSWQTRDESKNKYGGAVRNRRGYIYSFSGLSEHLDEMLAMTVSLQAWNDMARRDEIVAISGNPYLDKFISPKKNRKKV